MHENAGNVKIKEKRRVKSLTGIWREKPCKKNDQKGQKSEVEPSPNHREREREIKA